MWNSWIIIGYWCVRKLHNLLISKAKIRIFEPYLKQLTVLNYITHKDHLPLLFITYMCWNCSTSNIRILVVFLCIQDCFYEFHACCEKRTLLWGEKTFKLGLHIKQIRDNHCIANSRVSGWSNLYYSCKPLLAALHYFCSSHSTQNQERPASYHCKLFRTV